ncbi:phosphohydrolase [Sporanaerobium hydrogeniformans]|uniref:Phosphohydrolase n=1 Tax=Sporanaerobium hydrogeniformans TaxID=3072179 RepID=A0AC61DBX8_9FIRM|nr:HD domain-containing phosphohydrolase [Sporanaerobium hydrogeniformans]PHV70774.1 phosphohydrolase [Sporanaerobium hydrogeniformans]
MKKITLKDIVRVIQRTLDSMDDRLAGHGEKVAYIMYMLLKCHGGYSNEEILRLTTLAVFHDIGVYKIEEREHIIDIELDIPMNHSVYGYLFIKYFSPLSDLADIVLGHHLYPKDFSGSAKMKIPKEALILNLADTIAILQLHFNKIDPMWLLNKNDDYILEEHKVLFKKTCDTYHLLEKIKDDTYLNELYEILEKKTLSRSEIISYIRMLNCAIDFRSEATMLHTITVEEISFQISKMMGLDDDKSTIIKIASMLHDIGKLSIPIHILEKKGRLTKEEFEIIKSHAIVGYNILSDMGIDDIRDMATLHHEKLNGTGYPFGLKGNQISQEARIVAIADVLSALIGKRSYKDEFSKDKVISILLSMVAHHEIDKDICHLVIKNYDAIEEKVKVNTKEAVDLYTNLMNEYKDLLGYFEKIGFVLK